MKIHEWFRILLIPCCIGAGIGLIGSSVLFLPKSEPITEQNAVVTNGERTTYRFTDVEREALRTNIYQASAKEQWDAVAFQVDPRATYTFASDDEPEMRITYRSRDGTPWDKILSPTNVILWISGKYVPKLGKSNDQWVITFEKP